MKIESGLALDPNAHAALEELATTIRQHYPAASFRVSRGEDDPNIVQLIAVVDVEETEAVLDVVMDRMLELQEAGSPLFVVTERPRERTIAMREAARKRATVPTALL